MAATLSAPKVAPAGLAAGTALPTLSLEQMAARDLKFQPGSHGRDLAKGRDPSNVDPDRPSWMSAHDVSGAK